MCGKRRLFYCFKNVNKSWFLLENHRLLSYNIKLPFYVFAVVEIFLLLWYRDNSSHCISHYYNTLSYVSILILYIINFHSLFICHEYFSKAKDIFMYDNSKYSISHKQTFRFCIPCSWSIKIHFCGDKSRKKTYSSK